jgi:hypothetical protein
MKSIVKSSFKKAIISMLFASLASAGHAAVWDGSLPTTGNPLTSQQYQDFTIYSLNYLSNLSAKNTAPANPYYGLLPSPTYNVASDLGSLHDKVVVLTGNTGTAADNTDTCGATGCDNAYDHPSSAFTFFQSSTTPDPSVLVPGELVRSSWTAQASAMRDYLKLQDMVFMFNLNERNGGPANTLIGQSLLVAMRVQLTDADGNVLRSFYVGANNAIGLPTTAAQEWDANGEPLPADGPGTVLDTLSAAGYISTDPRWAYVHGAISVDDTTGAFLGMGDCTYTGFANCKTINQNLGANQVAFSAYNQELSDMIRDVNSGVAYMNVDFTTAGQNNGFEQLFIMAANVTTRTNVPEPGSLALTGLAALALCMVTVRRAKKT